jgi:hypothetical protein
MPPRHGGSPGAIPGNRTSLHPLHDSGRRLPRRSATREGGLTHLPSGLRPGKPIPTSRAPACAAESPKLSSPGAAPGRLANLLTLGAWQKSDAPALQAGSSGRDTRRPPPTFALRATARRAISLRETRPKHREKPHKLLQVGATPTPATSLRPLCNGGRKLSRRSTKREDGLH